MEIPYCKTTEFSVDLIVLVFPWWEPYDNVFDSWMLILDWLSRHEYSEGAYIYIYIYILVSDSRGAAADPKWTFLLYHVSHYPSFPVSTPHSNNRDIHVHGTSQRAGRPIRRNYFRFILTFFCDLQCPASTIAY